MRSKEIRIIENSNGCHICTSHKPNKRGYLKIMFNGRQVYMHRYIYELCNGEIPEGMVVRHTCDTPSCINPSHLEIGTQLDNIQDRVDRNRSAMGEKHWKSKLTEQDIRDIRNSSMSSYKAARIYNVVPYNIRSIRRYERWKHVI